MSKALKMLVYLAIITIVLIVLGALIGSFVELKEPSFNILTWTEGARLVLIMMVVFVAAFILPFALNK